MFPKLWLFIGFLVTISYILQTIPVFSDAYQKHAKFLETEHWRIESCKDPKFFNEMKNLNSDICFSLQENTVLIQSPFIVALFACLPFQSILQDMFSSSSKPHQNNYHYTVFLFFLLVAMYVTHSVLIPLYGWWRDKNEHLRLLEECSPMLGRGTPRIIPTWGHCGAIIRRQTSRMFQADT